jgi:hypothetical protein
MNLVVPQVSQLFVIVLEKEIRLEKINEKIKQTEL